jgi:hypothetical protein
VPVTEDMALFGEDDSQPVEPASPPTAIAEWQIDLLRRALDARGLTAMEDRQRAIEAAAERPVESLRSLTHDETLRVLAKVGTGLGSSPRSRSDWDEREHDTWIDQM